MADKILKSIKFPGLEDTYLMPVDEAALLSHTENKSNPHGVTIAQAGGTNPNLLDDWYFADPVCQRAGYYATFANGATTIPYYNHYSGGTFGHNDGTKVIANQATGTWTKDKQLSGGNADYGWINEGTAGGAIAYYVKPENLRRGFVAQNYCIDRWYFEQWSNTTPRLNIDDGHITLSCTDAKGDTNTNCIKQTIADPGLYSGKQVTFSVKFKNIVNNGDALIMIRHVGASGTKVANKILSASDSNSIVSVTTTLQDALTSLMVVIGNYANNGGDGNHILEIVSAKLELGSVSTLANDAPPNKALELLKCQRYYVRYAASTSGQWLMGASNGTTLMMPLHLPVPLQGTAAPTITAQNVNIYPYVSGGSVAVNSVSLSNDSSRQSFMIYAQHTSGNMASKEPGALRLTAGGFVSLSCEV